jgi:DNA mismatch repair protein MutL
MGKIKILPSSTITKIAAGEVIFRPVSIVKELIENSIDANAQRIYIEVEEGGIKEIRVKDDGEGMDQEDAILAFQRHATSKITSLYDLHNITSFGFRGEALASIAAVSQVELITRTHQNSSPGFKVNIKGSKLIAKGYTNASFGTEIKVRDLFFNTPVRRNCLRVPKAEFGLISELVIKYALALPHITFILHHNKKEVHNFPGCKKELGWEESLLARMATIWGIEVLPELIKLSYKEEEMEIRGFISKPTWQRNLPRAYFIAVNSRPIFQLRSLLNVINEAYFSIISSKHYPLVVIHLNIKPNLVDVNIHPSKHEVRFLKETYLFDKLKLSIIESLKKTDLTPSLTFSSLKTEEISKKEQITPLPQQTPLPLRGKLTLHPEIPKEKDDLSYTSKKLDIKFSPPSKTKEILTQLYDTYILFQSEEGLFIVDQHAACERILFEKLKEQWEDGELPAQRLLIPLNIKLTPTQLLHIKEKKEYFKKLGFELDEFSETNIIIRSVPTILNNSNFSGEELILSLLDELKSPQEDIKERILATLSCHGAIKANTKLPPPAQLHIIEELEKLEEHKYNCPHGRPTFIKFDSVKLAQLFRR